MARPSTFVASRRRRQRDVPRSSPATPCRTLLAQIDTITGVDADRIEPSPAPITLHTGTASNLIDRAAPAAAFGRARLRSAARDAARTGGGTAGTGTVIGNDQQTFLNEFDQRRRRHRLRLGRHAGQPAIALGQDRQRSARRRAHQHLEPVLPGRSERHRHPGRLGQCRHQLHLRPGRRADQSGRRRRSPSPT